MKSVLQNWVQELSFMQQSVLIAAIRAPDGLRKDHPIKVIMRWYRRCTLISAFDNKAILDPYVKGGGSFTGPLTENEFKNARQTYLKHIDEMPHHFQLHMMHAAEIIGYKHSDIEIRKWWNEFYLMIVNDAHLFPEPKNDMDKRLSDNEICWREREIILAD